MMCNSSMDMFSLVSGIYLGERNCWVKDKWMPIFIGNYQTAFEVVVPFFSPTSSVQEQQSLCLQLLLVSIVFAFFLKRSDDCLIFKIGFIQFLTVKNMMPRTQFWRKTCSKEADEERTVHQRDRVAKSHQENREA